MMSFDVLHQCGQLLYLHRLLVESGIHDSQGVALVAESISAAASRTSRPVIRLISFRSESAEFRNNCRWNSWTRAAPLGFLATICSAGDKASCIVTTKVSSLKT